MKKSITRREDITKRLEQEGIIIPPKFESIIFRNAMKHYGGKMPSMEAVEAVIKMCNYWKNYCADENEFSKLVCGNLYNMARIHAASINSNKPGSEAYITNYCKLKEGAQLPKHTITVATLEGGALIQENPGQKLEPITL